MCFVTESLVGSSQVINLKQQSFHQWPLLTNYINNNNLTNLLRHALPGQTSTIQKNSAKKQHQSTYSSIELNKSTASSNLLFIKLKKNYQCLSLDIQKDQVWLDYCNSLAVISPHKKESNSKAFFFSHRQEERNKKERKRKSPSGQCQWEGLPTNTNVNNITVLASNTPFPLLFFQPSNPRQSYNTT